ncbi:hypothetical protein AB0A77_09230 [Streptomyces varsoviensis]|uniref:hypothetical protein n=1 Tax=Streptomyces varsoviensis TaxID=67373 RepID=UPI0033E63E88
MEWTTWTTTGVIAGPGGVSTDEAGTLTGDITVHTTWRDGVAYLAVQHSTALDWYTMTGSPASVPDEKASRALHQAAVEAVREGGGAVAPTLDGGAEEAEPPAPGPESEKDSKRSRGAGTAQWA